jgi:hypothetical protein
MFCSVFLAICGMLCSANSNREFEERNLEVEDTEVEEVISRRKQSFRLLKAPFVEPRFPERWSSGKPQTIIHVLSSQRSNVEKSERSMLNGQGNHLLI